MDSKEAFEPLICVVNFDHQRGPEVEHWIGLSDGRDPVVEHDWTLLPFLALSDGSHQYANLFPQAYLQFPVDSTLNSLYLLEPHVLRRLCAVEPPKTFRISHSSNGAMVKLYRRSLGSLAQDNSTHRR